MFVFKKCYFDESWYSVSLDESTLTLSDRKLSTYVNALSKAGFVVEQSDDNLCSRGTIKAIFQKKQRCFL
jgi:hypothetical protein